MAARARLLDEVRGPAAGVLGRRVRVLVELDHAVDRPVEERAVVRDDHRATRELVVEEPFEAVQPGEVEVVGRFVEEEHVEPRQQDRREVRPGRLSARQRRHREIDGARGQAEVGEHRADAGVEVGRAEREVPVERRRVVVGRSLVGARERMARLVEPQLGRRHTGPAREVGAHCLARPPLGLLREVPDGRGRRRARHRSRVGRVDAGHDAQERALPGAVRRDDADAAAGADRQADAVEHDVRAERLGDVAGDDTGQGATGGSGRGGGHDGTCASRAGGTGSGACRARRRSGGPDGCATSHGRWRAEPRGSR